MTARDWHIERKLPHEIAIFQYVQGRSKHPRKRPEACPRVWTLEERRDKQEKAIFGTRIPTARIQCTPTVLRSTHSRKAIMICVARGGLPLDRVGCRVAWRWRAQSICLSDRLMECESESDASAPSLDGHR